MAEPAVLPDESEALTPTWSRDAIHVKRALAWLKKRRTVTPDELVEWDRTHGQRLFQWNNDLAAEAWRKQQARMFLNTFRQLKDGLRMRAWINLPESEEDGVESREYYRTDVISETPPLRKRVLDDLSRRMAKLADEMKFWKLTPQERKRLIRSFLEALG